MGGFGIVLGSAVFGAGSGLGSLVSLGALGGALVEISKDPGTVADGNPLTFETVCGLGGDFVYGGCEVIVPVG